MYHSLTHSLAHSQEEAIREELKKERDKEIEMVIQRLEAESHKQQTEIQAQVRYLHSTAITIMIHFMFFMDKSNTPLYTQLTDHIG